MSFSLKELMKLEDERLADLRREREEAEARVARARDETERTERARAEAEARATAQTRAEARAKELEELARHEAMQKAVVEQARLQVEVRARAEERERERCHEIELARVRAESKQNRGAGVVVGSGLTGAAAMLALCVVAYLAALKPSADQRVAALHQAVGAAEAHAGELGRRVEEQKRSVADLDGKLTSAKSRIRDLESASPESKKSGAAPPPRSHSGPHPKSAQPEGPCIDKFDPLCGRIDVK